MERSRSIRLFVVTFSIFMAVFLFRTDALRAEVSMKEGEWENSMETKMEGMPFPMPAISTKVNQCITKEDLVPKTDKENKCKVQSHKITGSTVSWKILCVDKDSTTEGDGEITYSGASYKGNMSLNVKDKKGETMRMSAKLAGKRLGDCKKDKTTAKADAKEQKADATGCAMSGWDTTASPDCEKKWGKLDFNEGNWDIAKEEVRTVVMISPPKVEKDKDDTEECLTNSGPAPLFLTQDPCVKDLRRDGNKVRWTIECTNLMGANEGDGEISYSGNSFTGSLRNKIVNNGMHMYNVTAKFTGTRKGDCAKPETTSGRDYTSSKRDYTSSGRDYTSQNREPSGIDKAKDKLKGLFKW